MQRGSLSSLKQVFPIENATCLAVRYSCSITQVHILMKLFVVQNKTHEFLKNCLLNFFPLGLALTQILNIHSFGTIIKKEPQKMNMNI